MDGWVPIPDLALAACQNGAEMGLVADLYKRARSLYWRPFHFTERSLLTHHKGIGNRRLWTLLMYLETLELCSITKGGRRKQSILKLHCPVQHRDQHRDQQNDPGSKGHNGESAAQAAAQGAAPHIETKGKELTTPPNPPSPEGGNRRERKVEQAAAVYLRQMQTHGAEGWDPDDPSTVTRIARQGVTEHDLTGNKRWVEDAIRLARSRLYETRTQEDRA